MCALSRCLLAASLASALAPTANTQTGFFIRGGTEEIVKVDLRTRQETVLGISFTLDLTELAWRRDDQSLWAVNLAGDIGTIDLATGRFTLVHATGRLGMICFTWDNQAKVFYFRGYSGNLHSFDPETLTVTDLGNVGASGTNYTVDAQGRLWSYNEWSQYYTVTDMATLSTSWLGRSSIRHLDTISLDEQTGQLYATIGTGATEGYTPGIYTVDPVTADATLAHAFLDPAGRPNFFEIADLPDGYLLEWLSSPTQNALHCLDFAGKATTEITRLGALGDLAWREDTQELWVLKNNGVLGVLDRFTGKLTVHDSFGLAACDALAWDPGKQRFFFSRLGDFYTYEPVSQTLTLITDQYEGRPR